jgi:hypothetical protein
MAENGRHKGGSALIAALAGGATVREAAAAARVGERTVYRRLEDADFARRVEEARAELLGRAMARLSAACTDAATTLAALLGAESESVRLGAARSILDAALRWREHEDLAARLDRVEAWLDVFAAESEAAGGKAGRWRARG